MQKDKYSDLNEDDLWLNYKESKNPEIREHFIRQYAPLVKYVAGKVSMGKPGSIEFDDLVGFGVFGLIDAIEKYDPAKNVKFKTYAVTRIRGAIYDELRSIDWVPRSIRQKAKEIETAINKIESETGRVAEDHEVAEALNVDIREFYSTLTKISGTTMISLSDPWYLGDDNDKITVLDTIECSDDYGPDKSVEREEIKNLIVKAINELPDKEKKVLVLYYYEDLTLKEIGEVLDVTESRVSQLHTKAIIRLKAKLSEIKEGIA